MSEPDELSAPPPADEQQTPDAPASRWSRGPLLVMAAVALVVVLIVGALVVKQGGLRRAADPQPPATVATPSRSPSASPTKASPSVTPSPVKPTVKPTPKTSVPAGCSATQQPISNPKSFSIARLGVTSRMLSLGYDGGAPAAPPLGSATAKTDVGWFNQGPKLGAAKGNAILTVHTYHVGGALGNRLQSSLKVGDQVQLTDATGVTLCYTYERSTKVWVSSYDPSSTVLFNPNGSPQAVIVICWDYDYSTRDWDSRLLFYLKPMGTPAR